MEQQQQSSFSLGNIAVTLTELPKKLYDSDVAIAILETKIADLKESIEIAEVNASLTANDDGKNEEKRKLQRAKAVNEDPEVMRLRQECRAAVENLELEKANNKQLSREFAGMCHISELKAAQMILQAKGVTPK